MVAAVVIQLQPGRLRPRAPRVVAELPDEYLEELSVKTPIAFRTSLFTEPATFVEAVRAAEGVVRDFLGIVGSAFFRAQRSGKTKIDINSVEEAARDWFEMDKATNLSEDQQQVLHRIIGEVIGDRQARSFLLERSVASHPMIQSLLDLREAAHEAKDVRRRISRECQRRTVRGRSR